jgi:CRP/FNR family transcriptional regulator, anaerobic regulatory protein
MHELCLPDGLQAHEMARLDTLISERRRVKRGDYLYRSHDKFEAIYAVKTGFFKTDLQLEDGRTQVTGFQMTGELLGFDGISINKHSCNAVALEDSEVCRMPFARLEELASEIRTLQSQLHRVMSREIVRDQGVMMLLGKMRADERLAAFLLNLSHRFVCRGYSASEFNLRMTRDEIGSYLGMKLETVSRCFSRFQDEGLIAVQQKRIRITDPVGLKALMSN